MKTKRNLTLSAMQGIGCLCVIFVHFPVKGAIGRILSSTGLIAVMLFFLTSGFYSYDVKPHKKIRRHLRKNFVLTVESICIYTTYTIIVEYCAGRLGLWIGYVMRLKVIPQMAIFGNLDLINGSHLWFLVAIVWSYLIMFVIEQQDIWEISYKMLPLAILFRVLVEIITNSTSISWHWSGNFLVGALPLMILGHFFAERQIYKKIALSFIMAMIFIGGGFNCIMTFIYPFNINFSQIGKVVAACGLFLYAMKFPSKIDSKLLSFIGENLSKNIYILHVLIGLILSNLFANTDFKESTFFPIAVVISTIMISCAIVLIRSFCRRRKAE